MFHSTADGKKQAWHDELNPKVLSERSFGRVMHSVPNSRPSRFSATFSHSFQATNRISRHVTYQHKLRTINMVEVSEKCPTLHKNTPSRSTTASAAADYVSKGRERSTENQTWQFSHPSASCSRRCRLYAARSGKRKACFCKTTSMYTLYNNNCHIRRQI